MVQIRYKHCLWLENDQDPVWLEARIPPERQRVMKLAERVLEQLVGTVYVDHLGMKHQGRAIYKPLSPTRRDFAAVHILVRETLSLPDGWQHAGLTLAVLVASCASTKPSTKTELNCENLHDAASSTKIGDFLEVACGCGAGQSCDLLALLLEKQGGAENLAAATAHRARGCRLGYAPACAPPDRREPLGSGGSRSP